MVAAGRYLASARATRAAGALKPEISPFTAHALTFGKAGGAVHRKLAQFDFINLGTHDRTPSPLSIIHCVDSDVCLSSASAARPSAAQADTHFDAQQHAQPGLPLHPQGSIGSQRASRGPAAATATSAATARKMAAKRIAGGWASGVGWRRRSLERAGFYTCSVCFQLVRHLINGLPQCLFPGCIVGTEITAATWRRRRNKALEAHGSSAGMIAPPTPWQDIYIVHPLPHRTRAQFLLFRPKVGIPVGL
jgi:hypothetical protein